MKDQILSKLEQPLELEKLYRKNKSEFKASFNAVYAEIQGKGNADFWHARLNFESETVLWGKASDWKFIVISAVLAWFLAKIPAFFGLDEEFFYPRNLGFLVFPFVGAYFVRKKNLAIKELGFPIGIALISLLYINLLPNSNTSDTLVLACIHLPLLLWGILGFIFSDASLKNLTKRLAYLEFNADAIIMGGVLGLSGLLLSGLTVGLFGLIGLQIEEFYFQNIGVFGLVAAPLIATHLTQTNPQLVNKIPPIIAKIFSPLVLIMLVVYLGAILIGGKDPYNDREFLLIFNLLLIGVMALIFFSVTEASKEESSKASRWILILLSCVTILVNLIALSAIGFRISEWGITPNRLAVLGVNILMLLHLVMVAKKLIQSQSQDQPMREVALIVVRYLPVYVIWTTIVVFLFPLIFGFD
jgi:hypothetical protein